MAEQILCFYIWVDRKSQEAVYERYLVSAGMGDHILMFQHTVLEYLLSLLDTIKLG